jgi:hypothetical protein
VTEQLLLQQLESPSGTGRDEPRSQISLPARTNDKRGCKPAHAFSLADLARVHPVSVSFGRRRHRCHGASEPSEFSTRRYRALL